jgi:hypothetical protein
MDERRAPVKVVRRSDKVCRSLPDRANDHCRVIDGADAHLEIKTLFDQVANSVTQNQVDREFFMLT